MPFVGSYCCYSLRIPAWKSSAEIIFYFTVGVVRLGNENVLKAWVWWWWLLLLLLSMARFSSYGHVCKSIDTATVSFASRALATEKVSIRICADANVCAQLLNNIIIIIIIIMLMLTVERKKSERNRNIFSVAAERKSWATFKLCSLSLLFDDIRPRIRKCNPINFALFPPCHCLFHCSCTEEERKRSNSIVSILSSHWIRALVGQTIAYQKLR